MLHERDYGQNQSPCGPPSFLSLHIWYLNCWFLQLLQVMFTGLWACFLLFAERAFGPSSGGPLGWHRPSGVFILAVGSFCLELSQAKYTKWDEWGQLKEQEGIWVLKVELRVQLVQDQLVSFFCSNGLADQITEDAFCSYLSLSWRILEQQRKLEIIFTDEETDVQRN